MSNVDQIEKDAGQTRDSLHTHVNELSDKVSPASFLQRRKDKLRETSGTLKDKVMGSTDGAGQAAGAKLSSAVSSVSDATDGLGAKVSGAAGGAPDALRSQTQGSPIAAGLIAFGVGWLLSALVPASSAEQSAAKRIEDNSSGIVDPLKQSAQEVAGNLQGPAQDAAAALKSTATDAASQTAEHAKSATADVTDQAKAATADVTDQAKTAANDVADTAKK